MSSEIVALATSGATAIVQAAATDAWSQTKRGFGRLLGQGDPAVTARAEAELEQTSAELAACVGEDLDLVGRQHFSHWEAALLRLLREYPGAQRELGELLSAAGSQTNVRIEANAYDNAQLNVLGTGTQNVTFN
jgi:hypothetical protein